mmetsp:Transcript_56197/g.67712  ORF Transcript_56197/g.67712 Transcript_56197/m.67712 type:complete len:611 (-) Transcript_56197:1514-3346(-)
MKKSAFISAQRNLKNKTNLRELNRRIQRTLRSARKKDYEGQSENEIEEMSTPLERIFRQHKFRIEVGKLERKSLIIELAQSEEDQFHQVLEKERIARVTESISLETLGGLITELVVDLCKEALRNDDEYKLSAEEKHGLYLHKKACHHYATYDNLCQLWIKRKKNLKQQIKPWADRDGFEFGEIFDERQKTFEELKLELELRVTRIKEAKVEEIERRCMSFDDQLVKSFYRNETKQIMIERRCMMGEEMEMVTFLKEEEIERKKKKVRYGVGLLCHSEPSLMSSRRDQLKKNSAERQRVKRESTYMEFEDELASAIQSEWKNQEQLKLLADEMRIIHEPEKFQESNLDCKINQGNSCIHIDGSSLLHCQYLLSSALEELTWMHRYEEAKLYEHKLLQNDLKVLQFSRLRMEKGKLHIRQRALSMKKEQYSQKCINDHNIAAIRASHCEKNTELCRKIVKDVEKQTKQMDTQVLTKFKQRWETTDLHNQLKRSYINAIIDATISRAEVQAAENSYEAAKCKIDSNRCIIETKTSQMVHIQRKMKRKYFLKLYRSALGKHIFPKTRRKIMEVAFKGWVEVGFLTKSQRGAYDLKYSALVYNVHSQKLVSSSY